MLRWVYQCDDAQSLCHRCGQVGRLRLDTGGHEYHAKPPWPMWCRVPPCHPCMICATYPIHHDYLGRRRKKKQWRKKEKACFIVATLRTYCPVVVSYDVTPTNIKNVDLDMS